ncbi:MAG: hypothetical protein E6G57_15700 [Actinobacteria bacterium]|nr:MAG: hypothetical protein E6G57_15700 [Actinomycetota bacterium]
MPTRPPLAGMRVVESSVLGPAEMGGLLADLGADVIKVEPPQGDYGRQMTWPIVKSSTGEGDNSLLSLHINRGKRSIAIDLRKSEGVEIYVDLVKDADVMIEAMRPGALAKRGLSYERIREINPRIVFCTISGHGATGPYKDYPSHGIAYDTWAGQVPPTCPNMPASASTPVRSTAPSPSSPRSLARVRRVKAATSTWLRPTPPPTSTGTGSSHGAPTSGPRTRSTATSPTTTSAAPPAQRG